MSRTQAIPASLHALASILVGVMVCASPAHAKDETRTESIHFAPGTSSTTIKGRIQGYSSVQYRVHAVAGQVLTIKLTPSNRMNYFTVLPPGGGEALDAAMVTNAWSGTLAHSGDYTVLVFLMRAAARRKESSRYTLDLALTGAPIENCMED